MRDALCDEFNHFVTCARWVVRVESRSEVYPRALRTKTPSLRARAQGLGPERRTKKNKTRTEREQKQSTTESLQQRTGRGRFDGRDVIASNKAFGSASIETSIVHLRVFVLRKTPEPSLSSSRNSPVFSRRLRPHVDGHELRERLGFTNTLKLSLVVRFRLTDRHHGPTKGGDLRARGKSVEVSQSIVTFSFSFVPPPPGPGSSPVYDAI